MNGRIAGTVKDSTGALIPGSSVVLTNPATGVEQKTITGNDGAFTFGAVPVGGYQLDVAAKGFTPYPQTNLTIDVNTALAVKVVLEVTDAGQVVTVTENTAQVETTDTQIGQTIEGKQITDIPLNGRSYTDLLAVQAGVTPITTSGAGNSTSGGGFGTLPAAGEANTGQFSINGQRESDNAYYLNCVSVQEAIGEQAGIIPNLDSVAEFRILSSNVDAEYGSFTGGIINDHPQLPVVGRQAGLEPLGRPPGLLIGFTGSIHWTATVACDLPAYRRRSSVKPSGDLTNRPTGSNASGDVFPLSQRGRSLRTATDYRSYAAVLR